MRKKKIARLHTSRDWETGVNMRPNGILAREGAFCKRKKQRVITLGEEEKNEILRRCQAFLTFEKRKGVRLGGCLGRQSWGEGGSKPSQGERCQKPLKIPDGRDGRERKAGEGRALQLNNVKNARLVKKPC